MDRASAKHRSESNTIYRRVLYGEDPSKAQAMFTCAVRVRKTRTGQDRLVSALKRSPGESGPRATRAASCRSLFRLHLFKKEFELTNATHKYEFIRDSFCRALESHL